MATLNVNGEAHVVEAPSDSALLWALRDDLGLRSAKYGCGAEQCGACTVLVDDIPMASCRLPLQAIEDRAVTTHEGLAGDQAYEAVVAALTRHNAGQCGYCLPGLVVTLTALVRRDAPIGHDDLCARLDDHLCRCGSHPRILQAAREVLEVDDGRL